MTDSATRQWVRVLSGKPGRGEIGYIQITWHRRGLTLIRFPTIPYPRGWVWKSVGTFEALTETECAVRELIRC